MRIAVTMDWKRITAILKAWIPELVEGFALFSARMIAPSERAPGTEWWQRPGWGIMYQIEFRPGWDWDRDYEEFNPSMRDEKGRFSFDGPLCRVEEWIELSREAEVDFHIMELKWHDGICYFDTALTDWKSDEDYTDTFSRMSREAAIPFMYYYSSVFDHNPAFDDIQPNRRSTFSVIGFGGQPEYEDYLRGQYREIVEKYRPDGMWIDWYWPGDASTETSIDFFRESCPEVVLGFNLSNYFPACYKRMDYTIGEAHELDGPLVKLRKTGRMLTPVICSTWKWAALGRLMMDHPWEAIAPAGRWWQDPTMRDDPNELVRMAAIVMACGGRFSLGATARMDGSIEPDQVEQLRILGQWFAPRRDLFAEALPSRYRGWKPSRIKVNPRGMKIIAVRLGDDILLHLINMKGMKKTVDLALKGKRWETVNKIFIEPGQRELPMARSGYGIHITIDPDNIDPADTILRLTL